MDALPGRPGNLTPEQDEALRRFWTLFLQTCGVFSNEGEHEAESVPASVSGQEAEVAGDKAKKKRGLSLFKKKDKDGDKSSKTTDDAIKANDADDKWGETKAYHETLAKHTPEQIRSTIWSMVKHDHPDALLLRFLRARKWDEHKALVMLMSCMNWRADEAHVDDDIMLNGEKQAVEHEAGSNAELKQAASDFLSQMRLAKTYIHGVDKSGRPMSIAHARLHKAGEQSQESLERYTVYLIETSRLMLTPPADTGCVMFDMTGFSLANMDYAPVKFMIKCFEANYPESLGVVLIHKSPWVFQGIWKIIRGWLDPVVASKVHFTNSAKDLEEFIDKDRIPKYLDGPEDWTFKYMEPVPGENDKMKDIATRAKLLQEREALYKDFESHTAAWIHEGDAEKRKALLVERNGVAKKLRQQYWQLDPYIRARSFYDRIGVIKGDGTVDHYPQSSATKPVPVSNGMATQETSADDVD
ncbi:CRAL-TRIO domain-containing protein [Microdochium bolleyi]|uniref:CRAL-TRIO domain-containing protein n=1 Tax=Microdochium bolleyi TaxID=196109 RepID=A0A136J0R2_9PEZI|nr:CRAL-TRIO domain-containing protein [Microdochium bolleyi]